MSAESFRILRFAIRCNDLVARAEALRGLASTDLRRLGWAISRWERFGRSAGWLFERYSGARLDLKMGVLLRLHKTACELIADTANDYGIADSESVELCGEILRRELSPKTVDALRHPTRWATLAVCEPERQILCKARQVVARLVRLVRRDWERNNRPSSTSSRPVASPPQAPDPPAMRLVKTLCGRSVSKRLAVATGIVESGGSVDDRLEKLALTIPIGGSTARELAELLGVSHASIIKSSWWRKHRRGQIEIDRRKKDNRIRGITLPEEIDD